MDNDSGYIDFNHIRYSENKKGRQRKGQSRKLIKFLLF